MGVDNISVTNIIPESADKRLSDISGYTAGSSSSGSSCSATHVNPPRGVRFSQATVASCSSSSSAASLQKEHVVLPEQRLAYLKQKYTNSDLLFNVLDYIDSIIMQIPREEGPAPQEEPHLNKPIQVKRVSKRLLDRDPKRLKFDEIPALRRLGSDKIVFAKLSKARIKYYAGKAWAALKSGEYLIEFYSGEVKPVPKDHVFEGFQDPRSERKVMFTRPDAQGRKVSIPALMLNVYDDDEGVLCNLMTDQGDINRVHISYVHMTEQMVRETNSRIRSEEAPKPVKKRKLAACVAPPSPPHAPPVPKKGGKACATPTSSSSSSSAASSDDSEAQGEADVVIAGCEAEQSFYVPYLDDKIKGKNTTPSNKEADVLGPLIKGNWFKGLAFILTCSKSCVSVARQDVVTDDESFVFTEIPYVYSHLEAQIKLGGGCIFDSYSDVPPKLIENLHLVAPRPCLTARYIECMTYNVKLVCHEWIVNCCKAQACVALHELPLGWSLEKKRFISNFERQSTYPFVVSRIKVKIACQKDNSPFYDFWSRLMKYCGADVRQSNRTRLPSDTIIIETGYENRSSIAVSPMWVVQSIIHGEVRDIDAHPVYDLELE